MKTCLAAGALVATIAFAPLSMAAMSQADCQAAWKKGDVNRDGLKAKPYIDTMIAAKEKPMDGRSLQSAEFLKSC